MHLVFLLFLLGVGSAASDATEPVPSRPYWTGRIEQDTRWHDTVYVGGDVTIAAAATLTLAPNTKVLFLPYRDDARDGLDSTRAELIVEGRLAAQAGGIVFRSADAGSLGADWYGLVIERGGRADVSYAAIRDGLRCLYAERGGRVIMDAIAFSNCGELTTPEDAAKAASQAEPMDSLVVKKQGSSFLRSSLRVGKKVASGTIVGIVFSGIVLGGSSSVEGDSGIGTAAVGYAAFGLGYPLGVYVVDARESSFWLTLIGGGLGWWGAATLSERTAWVTFFGAPVLASELSRKDAVTGGPKRPKPDHDLRFSLGLVPQPQRGLSAVATLRF